MRIPDRVPVWLGDAGYFPAKCAGFSCEEAMFESDKLFAAYRKTLADFAPDTYFGPGVSIRSPGGAFEATGCRTIRLPGRGAALIPSPAFGIEDTRATDGSIMRSLGGRGSG